MTPAIETRQVTKIFRTRWRRKEIRAVDGVSLRVEPGVIYGLLGPNGAGKTTFVKMLLSVVRPTSGNARVFGCDVSISWARDKIGYLPENHRFPTHLTGAEMLDFYAALSGMRTGERRRRIAELLDALDLSRWAGVRLKRYSKGMLQRLGLAQALMHSPSLLILDEPSDGVDPVGRLRIREILKELEARGVTIFINSHLLNEVEQLCRQVAILDRGRVVLTGKVSELTSGQSYCLRSPNVPEQLAETVKARASGFAATDGMYEFHFLDRDSANAAVDLLRGQGCVIDSLLRTRSTLEEVFMRTLNA